MSNFIITNDSLLAVGDDVYAKEAGNNFTGSPWQGDDVTANPQEVTPTKYAKTFNLPAASLDAAKSYHILKNVYSSAFSTNYASDANQLLSANVVSADLGSLCYVRGSNLSGGLVAGKPYWLINVVNGVGFELEATQGSGTPVTLTSDGTGMTYTLASRRSVSDFDEIVATLPASESSLQGEGYISAELQYILSIHGWLADGGRTDLLIDSIIAKADSILAKTNLINSGTVNNNNPNSARIDITRNDSYDGTANAAFSFTVAKDFTSGWTGTFTIVHRNTGATLLSTSVTITDATTLTVSLTSANTAFATLTTNKDFGPHPFDLQMTHTGSGAKQTVYEGYAVIAKDETT